MSDALAEKKHWSHSFVDRVTGDIEKAAKTPTSLAPYVSSLGTGLGQYGVMGALGGMLGATDAMFGRGVGDMAAGSLAAAGLVGSMAFAANPVAASWMRTIGAGNFLALTRSRAEKFMSGTKPSGSESTPTKTATSTTGSASDATSRISAVADKLG